MYKFSHLLYKLLNGVDTDDILISNKQFKKIHIDYHKYDKSLVKLLLSKHYNELKMAFEQKDKFIIVRSFDGNYLILDVLSEFIIKNEYLINEGYLTEKEVKRFNYLKSFLSYDKALEQINDTSFQYYYQQSYREMDVSKVINLLELNPDELKKILTNNSEKQLDEELIIML